MDGRVAIVTGAAGGIGREHALRLASEGAAVVVNDVADPEPTVTAITAAGGRGVGCRTDVTSSAGAAGLLECALDTFGDLHAVVNNAGGGATALFADVTDEAWDHELRLNLSGAFFPMRAAVRWWRARVDAGASVQASVVNTTSGAGLLGNAGQSPYGSAKAGVAALTVIAASELAGSGIRVNAIAPAARTDAVAAASTVIGRVMAPPSDPAGFDRWHPRTIAPLVVYLSSPGCPFTGEVFHVRGGVVGHFQGWTIGGTIEVDHDLGVDELAGSLPRLVAQAPDRSEAGGAAYASLRAAFATDQMGGGTDR